MFKKNKQKLVLDSNVTFKRLPSGTPAVQSFWVSVVGVVFESEMLQDTSWSSAGDESAAPLLSVVLHLKDFQVKPKAPFP